MHILFHLGHPAHFHLFRHVITDLRALGHTADILIKKKDVLEDLLKAAGWEYYNILPEGRGDSKLGLAVGMFKRDWRMYRHCRNRRPDLLIGTSVEISHIGRMLGVPSINVNEDDWDVVPMYAKLAYPLATRILSPEGCRMGKWEHKTRHYAGYHELAYLHPTRFTPDPDTPRRYFSNEKPYILLRFARLTAHHDKGISGIGDELARRIIAEAGDGYRVWITAERPLSAEFEPYRIRIDVLDMHHVMAGAAVYIGDSQTMAAEAGVLGIPFIRHNGFVGRISYLAELEDKYRLGFGIPADKGEEVIVTLRRLLADEDRSARWAARRAAMLGDKIDVSEFFVSECVGVWR
jgi:uncharacterized protein